MNLHKNLQSINRYPLTVSISLNFNSAGEFRRVQP